MQQQIYHALGLHMHQPPGNLKLLIESDRFEAEQIMRCYERAVRYGELLQDMACLQVGFSGILLEQFLDSEMIEKYAPFVDIPQMCDRYGKANNIELIGMGYYHPIFPLIPQRDWQDHLIRGKAIVEKAFGRSPTGFWPPEMAFCMEMIPALVEVGYTYVVVDGVHIQPESGVLDIYKPYQATYGGKSIAIIPRDRNISNAQESGTDPVWFDREVRQKISHSPAPDAPRLITTWSDGENGGWFRQMHEESGFFGHFFAPFIDTIRNNSTPVRSLKLSDYLQEHPPQESAFVQTGAWNVGNTSGFDLSQWAGSEAQKQAVETIVRVSDRYWQIADSQNDLSATNQQFLTEARELILEGETSCFLFWGDDWIPQLYERTRPAEALLERIES
ncbi:MAG: glycoside hydrolase family 57 [Cyanobacteria bacterium P01_E01_bin.42]